jgi:hypothetical protein
LVEGRRAAGAPGPAGAGGKRRAPFGRTELKKKRKKKKEKKKKKKRREREKKEKRKEERKRGRRRKKRETFVPRRLCGGVGDHCEKRGVVYSSHL